MPHLFSSVRHLVEMCFVQVGRLERCCCCLRGSLCAGSDTNDALRIVLNLAYQDVGIATASRYAVYFMFFCGCYRYFV